MFRSWKDHPVTQEIFRLLKERVQERKDMWANGNLMSDTTTFLIANNAMGQGYCRACEDMMNIEVGQLFEKEASNAK